jgi:hypothetical protein
MLLNLSTWSSLLYRKLAHIPFPFPHAQMVTATLLLFTATLPVMIAAFLQSPVMAALLSAMTQVCYVIP